MRFFQCGGIREYEHSQFLKLVSYWLLLSLPGHEQSIDLRRGILHEDQRVNYMLNVCGWDLPGLERPRLMHYLSNRSFLPKGSLFSEFLSSWPILIVELVFDLPNLPLWHLPKLIWTGGMHYLSSGLFLPHWLDQSYPLLAWVVLPQWKRFLLLVRHWQLLALSCCQSVQCLSLRLLLPQYVFYPSTVSSRNLLERDGSISVQLVQPRLQQFRRDLVHRRLLN
jgi:hypothetical protein